MLTAQLEDRFRAALGDDLPDTSVTFAIEFTRLLARIVPEEVPKPAREAMKASIGARTSLDGAHIDTLLELALAPEARSAVTEDELRAYGSRFGHAEEEALRQAVAEEIDLSGFAERYGAGEALLLLDALFAVCAVDGVIDQAEIRRLNRSAAELGIDAMLVGALFRKHDIRHATGDFQFTLSGERHLIGRSNVAEINLPDPQVAIRHAELVRAGDGWRIVDLNSGRPTLVNGKITSSRPFGPGDQLRVGSYTLSLDPSGTTLTAFGSTAFSALSVRNLRRKIGEVTLLDDVSFTVFSGEVIAVVGPSGAGKTTLLNAIAGIAPADSGDVLLDGQNFHSLLANDRSIVGIVPQDDVIHPELTVEESLFYSGKLRFPSDVGNDAILAEVDRVTAELGIDHIRTSRIGDAVRRGISGGQRKRVNLGQEMLTRSTKILFLDEPTSGLDPQTAQDIVSLIRQLADDGRIVFLVTHDVTPSIMSMVDHLLVLAPGGRVAWFGPPDDSGGWFGVRSPDEIFARLPDKQPPEWGAKYREGPAFKKYVRTREHLLGLDGVETTQAEAESVRFRRSRLAQYFTLTRRYAKVKMRDVTGLSVLLAQAPILAVAMWIVFPKPDISMMFMLSLSALWFGASASVRELIAERTIWRREARVGLGTAPYVASKVTVLGTIVAIQCILLAGMNFGYFDMANWWPETYEDSSEKYRRSEAFGYDPWILIGFTVLTGEVGMAMGLLVSSLFSSSEAAVGTLPLLLIPQITFGGLLVKVKKMGDLAIYVSYLMIVRYSFEAHIKAGSMLNRPGAGGGKDTVLNIKAHLYELGFRTSEADDMGLAMTTLAGVLMGFLAVFLLFTSWFTWRSKDGN